MKTLVYYYDDEFSRLRYSVLEDGNETDIKLELPEDFDLSIHRGFDDGPCDVSFPIYNLYDVDFFEEHEDSIPKELVKLHKENIKLSDEYHDLPTKIKMETYERFCENQERIEEEFNSFIKKNNLYKTIHFVTIADCAKMNGIDKIVEIKRAL